VAGPFGHLLESTLPFHKIHALSTGGLVAEIMEAPLTWGALAVIALGLLAWWGRERLTILTRGLGWLGEAASQSFGFEWLNRQVVCATQSVAQALRVTQPGDLSWNVVGIIGGLVAVLIILTWG
jgi:NADH-quinone oxidoreductase subunit L